MGARKSITYSVSYKGEQNIKKSFASPDTDFWLDYCADSYAGGKGTVEDPYIIETPEQLVRLVYECQVEYFDAPRTYDTYQNGSYRWVKLVADLDMGSKIWNDNAWFMGHFDGGGHTIDNLHGKPLFSSLMSVSNNAANEKFTTAIVNLTLRNANITVLKAENESMTYGGILANEVTNTNFINCALVDSDLNAVGVAAGGMIGEYQIFSEYSGCQIMGCSLDNVTVNGGITGGMIGYLNTGNTSYGALYLRDSYFNGDLNGTSVTGGLIGCSYYVRGVYIDNCYVELNKMGVGSAVGGLVGKLYSRSGVLGGKLLGPDGYNINGVFILGEGLTASDDAGTALAVADDFISIIEEGKGSVSNSAIADDFLLNGEAPDEDSAQKFIILPKTDYCNQAIWEEMGYDFSENGLWHWNETTNRPEIKHEWLDFSVIIVTRQPEPPVVYQNMPGYIATEALGGLGNITYQWQCLRPEDRDWKDIDKETDNILSIEFSDAYSDGTLFRCKITDLAGRSTYTDVVTLKFSSGKFDLKNAVDTLIDYYKKQNALIYEGEALALSAAGIDPKTFENNIGSASNSISYSYYAMIDHILLDGDINNYVANGGGFTEEWDWFEYTYSSQEKFSSKENFVGRVYTGSSTHSTSQALLAMDIFAPGAPWGNEDQNGKFGRAAAINALLATKKTDKCGYLTIGNVDSNVYVVERPNYSTQSEAVILLARLWNDPEYADTARELLPKLLEGMIYDYNSSEYIESNIYYNNQKPRIKQVADVAMLVSALVAGADRVDDLELAEQYTLLARELIDEYILPAAAIGGGFRSSKTANSFDADANATARALMAISDYINGSCFLADYVYDIPAEKAVELELARINIADSVKDDLELRKNSYYGTVITWQTSDAGIITADGKVTRADTVQDVVLTVTAIKDGYSNSKSFNVKVRALGTDSQYDVDFCMENAIASMSKWSEVLDFIELPEPEIEDVVFEWVCSEPGIIQSDGTVNRPDIGQPDITITLTLTAFEDDYSRSYSKDILVYAKSDLATQEGKLREGFLGSRIYYLNNRSTNGYWDIFAAYSILGDYISNPASGFTHTLPQPDSSWYGTQYGAMVMAICAIGENPYNYRGADWVALLNENYGGIYAANLYSVLGMEAAGANPQQYSNYSLVDGPLRGAALMKNVSMGIDIASWAAVVGANHLDNAEIADYVDYYIEYVLYEKGVGADGNFANSNYISTACAILGLSALYGAGIDEANVLSDDLKNPITGKGPIDAVYDAIWGKTPISSGGQMAVGWGDLYRLLNFEQKPSWLTLGVNKQKLNQQIAKADNILANRGDYPAANVSRLENALSIVNSISKERLEAKVVDWGKEYYDLYDAVRYINSGGNLSIGNADFGIGNSSGLEMDNAGEGISDGNSADDSVQSADSSTKEAQGEPENINDLEAVTGESGDAAAEDIDDGQGNQKTMTVFEIVKHSIQTNPLLTAGVIILTFILIFAGGYARYRRGK